MDYMIVFSLLFVLSLVTECRNSSCSVFMFSVSCSIPSFYILAQLVFLIDSTQLGGVLRFDPIRFVWRLKYF